MKTTAVAGVLLTLLAVRLTTAQAAGDDGDRIEGAWVVSSGEKAGRQAPDGGLKDVTLTFRGDRFTWTAGGRETRGTFSIDPARSPRRITMSAGGKTLAGIYRLDGDALTVCARHGDDPPRDFATRDGEKAVLLVLKRRTP
jgi:uncharacterized protein (TIGR03067 family)